MRTPLALLLLLTVATPALAQTTLEQRITGDRSKGFSFLKPAPGEPVVVREDLGAKAAAGRESRRRSLAYFGQLSDFQLADEESPTRVEFSDQSNGFFGSAWRPQEALAPFTVDQSIRQMNELSKASPVRDGSGKRARMGFVVTTGDNTDNSQGNEVEWVAKLLDGGTLHPNSGSPNAADYTACPAGTPGVEEGARYTGVQDYDDYVESGTFYDPDQPAGGYAGWPAYPGLMDKAQLPFETPGLKVPSYLAQGNHDLLVQGNQWANAEFDQLARSCFKPMTVSPNASNPLLALTPSVLASSPGSSFLVPPDPRRRFITAPEYRQIMGSGGSKTAHGLGLVDKAQLEASFGAANYYDYSPRAGLRMIALDSVCNGGIAGPCADGNIDDPQFKWLEEKLKAATAADELVMVYSHHGPTSLTADVPDEAAPACNDRTKPQDERNPGCDLDPRSSQPVHLGGDMVALLQRYPHVVAWVAGHSHVNDVTPYLRKDGGFWVVRTSAEADWPHQDRVLDLMDNGDGTLSLHGVLLDNASPVQAPPSGTPAAGLSVAQLASIGRTLGFNDPQAGSGTGEGAAKDHNVELLVRDPRRAVSGVAALDRARGKLNISVTPRHARAGRLTRFTFTVRNGRFRAAKVRIRAGGRTVRTDRRGRAVVRLRLTKPGRVRLRVAVPGRGTVRLAPIRVWRRR
jgi:metallophosphoesterase (TIGR03767 family)